jgi:hypothetical protein
MKLLIILKKVLYKETKIMKIIQFKKTKDLKFVQAHHNIQYVMFRKYFRKKLKLFFKMLLNFCNTITMFTIANKVYFHYTLFRQMKFQKLNKKFKKI